MLWSQENNILSALLNEFKHKMFFMPAKADYSNSLVLYL